MTVPNVARVHEYAWRPDPSGGTDGKVSPGWVGVGRKRQCRAATGDGPA